MEPNSGVEDFMQEVTGAYPLSPVVMEAIKFIFNNPYESMVIINKRGEIEFIDRMSEKVFEVPHGAARGKMINQVIPNSELINTAKMGMHDIGKTLNVLGKQRIVSRFPLVKNGRIVGAFGRILFHSFEELERVREEANRLRIKVIDAEEKMLGEHQATYTFDHILGESKEINQAKDLAGKIAQSDRDVLIYGESGTGKELFAHAIHNKSARRFKPFVKVNCPAIPIEIAESELFGYVRGAFTGASKAGRAGKFELAQGGTVFLDEIGALPISIQAKLLRVIQEREIERLGSQKLLPLNIRLIAASNARLKELAGQGRFREDLLFRLSKVILEVPPLREHVEDIPLYAGNYLKVLNKSIGGKVKKISKESLSAMMKYPWPGNVRELINVLEQSLFNAGSASVLSLENLPDEVRQHQDNPDYPTMKEGTLKEQVEKMEKEIIFKSLQMHQGNKRRVAQHLGIQRSVLYIKLKKYGLGIS